MTTEPTWIEVDTERATQLASARVMAHWAAQIPASLSALVAPEEDYSHTNLLWNPAHHTLQSRPVPTASRPVRAGLRVSALALSVAVGDVIEDEYLLRGQTLDNAQQWLAHVLEDRGITKPLARPEHDLPASTIENGGKFDAEGTNLAALESWFSNAAFALAPFAKRVAAGELRGWPHHFDLAALKELDATAGTDAESAPSVNIGFSPGDGSYDEPYFYVTPWPRPPTADKLPPLPTGGKWHTEGFFAAVLVGSALPPSGDDQLRAVQSFLSAAFEISLSLIPSR